MTDVEQRTAAKQFAKEWVGRGYEKGESQKYWMSLLQKVYGVEDPAAYIVFEEQVHLDHTSFIDGYIPATHVLIEQKALGKDLLKPIKQSDGSLLTPFQQAKRYAAELPFSQRPRWIITCNFSEFYIYDMERPGGDPEHIELKDLGTDYYRLNFLVDTQDENIKKEMEISLAAGELVGKLYDGILKQYHDPTSAETLKSLNKLCVRLVFCLYAEDAGIFGGHARFHNYLKAVADHNINDVRRALIDLFKVLDTPEAQRDPYMDDALAAFPYVNGGLFADENIEIPRLTADIVELLLSKASEGFDWSAISPTIFGAVFESTLNPDTRRSGGMHYTSIENIHKVIDPLFLDELREEFESIKETAVAKTRAQKLKDFQMKLASLCFLDPACGSGNFLTETYLSLRRLENETIKASIEAERGKFKGQITLGNVGAIKVSISQFYGIEINDFACTVAKTALWIAESQMMKETEDVINTSLDFLPLKTNANIVEGNALRIDWESVVPKSRLSYIMGNPPFVGQTLRSREQSDDMIHIFGKGNPETKLDYVLCWYKLAVDLMTENINIVSAFVSTNSICQGESVPTFWKRMATSGVEIEFAYTSFQWTSESNNKAGVYCVIIGFDVNHSNKKKVLFNGNQRKEVQHINGYLFNAPDIFITSRVNSKPSFIPKIEKGSEPSDGGNLFLTPEERDTLITKYPILEKYIRKFTGGNESSHNKPNEYSRYCLWFEHADPSDYTKIPEIRRRLENIRTLRAASTASRIQKRADFPQLFCQIRQPDCNYILIPHHSTSSRRYVPIALVDKNIICGNSAYVIASEDLGLFGILCSNVHNAWMRTICGRLAMAYRYTPAIYNNFPWINLTSEQIARIEQTAQAILDAREKYPNSSLADLYDELTMPPELRKAHQENDKAVMSAYGFKKGDEAYQSEAACVAVLMERYQKLAETKK